MHRERMPKKFRPRFEPITLLLQLHATAIAQINSIQCYLDRNHASVMTRPFILNPPWPPLIVEANAYLLSVCKGHFDVC